MHVLKTFWSMERLTRNNVKLAEALWEMRRTFAQRINFFFSFSASFVDAKILLHFEGGATKERKRNGFVEEVTGIPRGSK